MSVFLMVIVLATGGALHVMGAPYQSRAACEADKPSVTAKAIAAGFTEFGLSCTDEIHVGKPS